MPIIGPRFSSTSTFEIAFCNRWDTRGHPPSKENSGLMGQARSQPASGRSVVCGNHTASNLVLTSLQQTPQEQSTSHQLRRLIVSPSLNIFILGLTTYVVGQAICGKATIATR